MHRYTDPSAPRQVYTVAQALTAKADAEAKLAQLRERIRETEQVIPRDGRHAETKRLTLQEQRRQEARILGFVAHYVERAAELSGRAA